VAPGGIEARIRNEPPRVLFSETLSRRRFTGAAMFAWISSPELVPRTTLHSDEIPRAERNWSGQNYTGFRNAEMDALLEAIRWSWIGSGGACCGTGCRRSTRRSCRSCRSSSAPTRTSGPPGWRACAQPAT
jgi:hypothetical protein